MILTNPSPEELVAINFTEVAQETGLKANGLAQPLLQTHSVFLQATSKDRGKSSIIRLGSNHC